MARLASRFSSLAAAVFLFCLAVPARADVPLRSCPSFVDGVPARPIATFSDGAHVMASLENVAADLKYALQRKGATWLLQVGGDVYTFTRGNDEVLMGGDVVLQTSTLPVERHNMLFVAIPDLQSILSQTFAVTANRIDIAASKSPEDLHAAPVLRPHVSTYSAGSDVASGTPLSAAWSPVQSRRIVGDPTNAVVIHAELSDYGGFASRDVSFTTDGPRIRGNVDVSAFDNSAPGLTGEVAVGTSNRYVQFGYAGNPLGGLLFNAPGGDGVSVQRDALSYGVERDTLGRTIAFVRNDLPDGSTFYGFVQGNGMSTPIVGDRSSTDGIVKVTREIWLTDGGAAASIGVATQGRVFGEAIASATTGSVPLVVGEAPQRIDVGFRADDFLTLRAGVTSGYDLGASPYLAASAFGPGGSSFSLQVAGNYRTASASYNSFQSQLSGSYTSSPSGADWMIFGSTALYRRLWEFTAYQSAGNQDDAISTRTAGRSGFIFGAERIVSGGRTRIGPIVGVALPVSPTSSLDLTEHPTTTGRTLGFGFTQRVAFNPRVPTRRIKIEHAAAALLYVDDHLALRIDASVDGISIAAGRHLVQARSANGNFASLPAAVDERTTTVDVALLPVRQIVGRVVQVDADPAGRTVVLAHIQIRLEPGDQLVETEADGSFIFPPTPVAPNARIAIVASSLPDDLRAGDDAAVAVLPLILGVKTRVKVHRTTFPSGRPNSK